MCAAGTSRAPLAVSANGTLTVKEIILLKQVISDSGYLDSTADAVPNVLSQSPSALQKWLYLGCREAFGGEKPRIELLCEGMRLYLKSLCFQITFEEIVQKELLCRLKITAEKGSQILLK